MKIILEGPRLVYGLIWWKLTWGSIYGKYNLFSKWIKLFLEKKKKKTVGNLKGTFGTLNVDYIRNSNLYYWEYKTL